ncbi:MAG: FAD-dependent monooxygenase [Lysobacterales bacterium]
MTRDTEDKFAHIPQHKPYGATPPPPGHQSAPVVIVGGGPVGLTAALDLGQRGHRVIVLNQLDFIAAGSKAICFAKRTLDIWNRLGVGQRMVKKGVIWNVGKVFRGQRREPVFEFDMLPVKDQEMPGFINLQQYWAEEFLVDAVFELPNVELRWGHQVTALDSASRMLTVDTGRGTYSLSADWIIASDGCRSPIRDMLGLDFEGRVFEDNFLIADVKFEDQRPSERWFWFDPPWGGASSLLHKQPDDVWRLDFQLGWDIDREAAIKPENVEPFVRGMIGDDIEFSEEWYSVYTFQCRRMARFVHDRVIFVGDSAHLVSPFGARGCNGGIADVDNLAWKLDAVIGGADPDLIETYNDEAVMTADENILNSSRSTDFMTPKSPVSQAYRDAVLDLAEHHSFARPFVNSGRLSTPINYPASSLVQADTEFWHVGVAPGHPAVDAPFDEGWLLQELGGHWSLLTAQPLPGAKIRNVVVESELARKRYGLDSGGAYLIRPDQYVAARWKTFTSKHLENFPWLN